MAIKNNRRTQITKMLLKTSLIELMHEKNMNQITIKELCERADLNRSTFYLHYTDQYALLEDIENEMISTTFAHLQNVGPTLDTLSYIVAFLDYVKDNKDIFQTLLCTQKYTEFQEVFIAKIIEQIKDKLPLNCSSEMQKYVHTFLLHGSTHIIIDWINNDFRPSSAEIARLIYELCDRSCRMK